MLPLDDAGMSDFFLRLAARSLDSPPAALPRIASRFATPGWDRSPQVDTPFAASAEAEQPPPPPAAERPRHDRTMLAASPPPTAMVHDRPATSSPRRSQFGSHIFAVDAENVARKTTNARASGEMTSDSHTGLNAIESRREALASGPERSAQFVPASLSGIRAADRVDPFPEAGGPFALAEQAGTAPVSTSRPWNEARDASSDIARVTPWSTDEAPAGLARATLDVSEPARSRPATPDRVGAMPHTPPAPEIHVSIGRIEVRAVIAPVAATPSPRRAATGPALSLEAYLRERQEGSR